MLTKRLRIYEGHMFGFQYQRCLLTKVILKAITNENYLETEYTDCKKGLEIFFPGIAQPVRRCL